MLISSTQMIYLRAANGRQLSKLEMAFLLEHEHPALPLSNQLMQIQPHGGVFIYLHVLDRLVDGHRYNPCRPFTYTCGGTHKLRGMNCTSLTQFPGGARLIRRKAKVDHRAKKFIVQYYMTPVNPAVN